MKITKDMLDKKICEFEECSSDTLTYRDWIREHEDFYELGNKDLDSMTDEELKNYDDFIVSLTIN